MNWYHDRKADWARRKSRTQSLWVLTMAGDWHASLETMKPHPKPHLMRVIREEPVRTDLCVDFWIASMHEPGSLTQVMMVSNIDVEAKFANGTQENAFYSEI